jgi:hypothetical protein
MGNPHITEKGHKVRHPTVNISEYIMQHALKIKYSMIVVVQVFYKYVYMWNSKG